MEATNKTITLEEKDFKVPEIYKTSKEEVVPMYAGETIKWSIAN